MEVAKGKEGDDTEKMGKTTKEKKLGNESQRSPMMPHTHSRTHVSVESHSNE